jgi:hypothetical protein
MGRSKPEVSVRKPKAVFEKLRLKRKEKRFFSDPTNEEIFNWIYETDKWGSAESVSGTGSTLDQTRLMSQKIPGLLEQLKVRTLLDIPCGDLNWLQTCRPGD